MYLLRSTLTKLIGTAVLLLAFSGPSSAQFVPHAPAKSAFCLNPSGAWIPVATAQTASSLPNGAPATDLYGLNGTNWYGLACDANGNLTSGGTFIEQVITFSGTAGSFSHLPAKLYGLYRNGIRMTSLAGSPAVSTFSAIGTTITLSTAAGGSDVFIAVYTY